MPAVAKLSLFDVAKVAHEAERAYRSATHDGVPALAWEDLDEGQRDNAVRRVRALLADPSITAKNPAEIIHQATVNALVACSA